MRYKRNYLAVMKRFFSWFSSRFKPLTVHTESLLIDSVWKEVQKRVKNKEVLKWYVITPANKDYFKSEFNINLSKQETSEILKERYKWMVDRGEKIELHIHLSLIIGNMSYDEQDRLFKDSIDWFEKNLGFKPKEFVPGWWSYNKNTLEICKKYSLKMIKERDYDYVHDYDWVL